MANINVLYFGCPYDLSGYGTVSRNHLIGLSKIKNLNIRLKVKKFWSGVSPDLGSDKDILEGLEKNLILNNNDFIFIEHLTPENFYIDPRAKYHIAYTPFETSGAPIPWLLPLRGMDEIWVPSQYNKIAYISVGLNPDKIHVIPHGVNISRYNPSIKPLHYNKGKFNFGSVFDWTERKNPTALIRAYYNAFYKEEDVTLTIRTFWRFPIEKTLEYVTGEINKIKGGYGDRIKFPKILLWIDTLDNNLMPNLFRSFDCFVLPTRGEGFGLPFIESMACGVPVIGPLVGGNTEFMNDKNSILVGGNVVPIEHHQFLSIQPQYSGQKWFDIDEVQLSKSMRWAYDNQDRARALGQCAAKDIKENWTWDHTIGKITKRLLEIDNWIESLRSTPGGENAAGKV